MADFKIKNAPQVIRTKRCLIASATVIEAGDLVALSSGLIIKAVAASTAVAFAPEGSAAGDTEISVTEGNDFTLLGTSDAATAQTDAGILCDLVGTTTQLIDVGTSSTNVLRVSPDITGLNIGETTNIEVRINKPLF